MEKEYTCEFCGDKFTGRQNRPRRFCSNACNINFKNKFPKRLASFICKQCGGNFSRNVYPSLINKAKFDFCSPICRNKARALIPVPCPVCGNLFSPRYSKNKYGIRKFCSQKCSNISNTGKPSTNPYTHTEADREYVKDNYTTSGIKLISERLGISRAAVYVFANKMGLKIEKVDYSSMSERMKKNNPMKNPEIAARVGKKVSKKYWEDDEYRERLLKSKAEANKKSMTKPELLCKKILEEIGIEAEYQVEIKSKFIVDFRIENVILQVDGEYWHGHPRFEPLTERQLAQRKRDAAQNKYLTACGYKVVRLWESQITKENIIKLFSQ